ncbi:MAG: GNAT family N-acetyltransferase [Gemmatimonadales bacterium]|nr:GNAT family N-acetyltransferase [Gemmatimonadales bacterium]
MNVTVRRLEPGDESVARAVARGFKDAEISDAYSGMFLANSSNYLIVAEAAGKLAGFLLAYRLDRIDRPTGQLFVYEVAVDPSHRQQGIGTALMQFTRSAVEHEGMMEAFTLTSGNNAPAIALYSGTGAELEDDTCMLFVYPGESA